MKQGAPARSQEMIRLNRQHFQDRLNRIISEDATDQEAKPLRRTDNPKDIRAISRLNHDLVTSVQLFERDLQRRSHRAGFR